MACTIRTTALRTFYCALLVTPLLFGEGDLRAQSEIGFIERFALADDRREALAELIPGTEDYYYFHCLHYQNEGQLADAEALLLQWRTKLGDTPQAMGMVSRQMLLTYADNPERTTKFLREALNLNFSQSPPTRDRAATLPTVLDPTLITFEKLLDDALAQDRSLARFEASGLAFLLDKPLSTEQLRAVLGRLARSDSDKLVPLIAQELALKDSAGFGWAPIHRLLTLDQLDALLAVRPELVQAHNFVREYLKRLAPAEGVLLTDSAELRIYLQRLLKFVDRLPPSQNSLRALVLGNLLRLDLSEGRYDRGLFLRYLQLPRSASYYSTQRARANRDALVDLNFTATEEMPLPSMSDDALLVQRHLEHFLANAKNVDEFAEFLDRKYLDLVFAETKILSGIGDARDWYAKLSPSAQRELRERIEIRFAPNNPSRFASDAIVSLGVELKNVDELLVKIYEINTRGYYRNNTRPVSTDIDLDGLVANSEKTLTYSLPADRRHVEQIEFPELQGRGVWVIDFLGATQRSRALVQKGTLIATEYLGDAGHELAIFDENGRPAKNAHLEFEGRQYTPEPATDGGQSKIIVPYAEKTRSRQIVLIDDEFAVPMLLAHRSETYKLDAGFLLDQQSLVAGTRAAVVINPRLTCNDRPVSIELVENMRLTMTAVDASGISTSQNVGNLDVEDGDELTHAFLVPQRLRQISFTLSGTVESADRSKSTAVTATRSFECNQLANTDTIGDGYLQQTPSGYRLAVLGRNGEPLSRLPLTITVKPEHLNSRLTFNLATDNSGFVQLGEPESIESLTLAASGLETTTFDLHRFSRVLPLSIHSSTQDRIELPLGEATTRADTFTLFEVRRGTHFVNLSAQLELLQGSLKLPKLAAGDYILRDYKTDSETRIRVAEPMPGSGDSSADSSGTAPGSGDRADATSQTTTTIFGKHRILDTSPNRPLIIRDAAVDGDSLVVKLAGADRMSRVHLFATVFTPGQPLADQIQSPRASLSVQPQPHVPSFYADSLKIDEEYSYVLERRGLTKYPGNMLSRPSLLVQPWEVSVTENLRREAQAGDAMPKSSAAPSRPSLADGAMEREAAGSGTASKCFDFLAGGAAVLANLGVENGEVRIPLKQLTGYSSLTIVAVHPLSSDSRTITIGDGDIPVRDQRLKSAFAANQHLAQTQRVEILASGQELLVGDPKTRRVQTFSSLAEVFQLYSTLLDDSAWEKFRFLQAWHTLDATTKQTRYSEQACHELNFFLHHHDRPFFDSVVKPLLEQKLDKQLIDLWLLDRELDAYAVLWRQQRLNTLERILLAQRVASTQSGTMRWMLESVEAYPFDVQRLQSLFETALSGRSLDTATLAGRFSGETALAFGGGGYGGRMPAADAFGEELAEPSDRESKSNSARELRRAGSQTRGSGGNSNNLFFQPSRMGRTATPNQLGLFQSLDKTREWAETQYYRTRLGDQTAALIAPNAFWQQYLESQGQPFVPRDLVLPCNSLSEALCALAVIDLPFAAEPVELRVENDELIATSASPAILFLESIEPTSLGDDASTSEQPSILVGQDIYLAEPETAEQKNVPVQGMPLLRSLPYRASVVVTNTSSEAQRLQVLTQVPAGSIPLAGGKATTSQSLELAPYSTAQIQYSFYFPQAGEFEHYGAQISQLGLHTAETPSVTLRVLAEPESVEQNTWRYVADWGTDADVLEFLANHNLEQLELSRIAFRLQNVEFYRQILEQLAAAGRYDATLWAFAIQHQDTTNIEQYLQSLPAWMDQLGPALESPILHLRPAEQMSYEHLDYEPLVVARTHQLGSQRTILNPSLQTQYQSCLNLLSHQAEISDSQRLQLCYYHLLQNRITEAIAWFDAVDADAIETKLQHDYFAAYLSFYRGDYAAAKRTADAYQDYPHPRWNALFTTMRRQVEQRDRLLAGTNSTDEELANETTTDASQALLSGQRESLQGAQAGAAPSVEFQAEGSLLTLKHRNVERLRVDYYLMDIELLFSRRPFVSLGADAAPAIRANQTQELEVNLSGGSERLELPADLRNRNVLIEVSANGVTRRQLLTANALDVRVTEAFGLLQVLQRQGAAPVEAAYVKVYAQNKDGSVRFYKDGYTDLRGQFDYATLSTNDLESVKKFSILVLDESLGASVHESVPPAR